MKRYLLLILVALCIESVGQCGLTGDTIEVYTAEDWLQLADCDSVYGSLLIQDWDVSDLSQMQQVVWVEEHLILNENISLLNDDDLSDLTHVGGDLVYSSNFTLLEINGLASLEHLGGDLRLEGNITLETISGIGSISSINGDLVIQENHTLEDLWGLGGVDAVMGNVFIGDENLVLSNLEGLDLGFIGGDLYVSLPAAIDLTGLEQLGEVHGNMTLENMPLLANVDALDILYMIQGSLNILNNGSLVQIDGLFNLTDLWGDMNIHDNPSLFLCCGVYPLLTDGVFYGEANIHDNSSNCSSVDEILDYCWVGIDETLPEFTIRANNHTLQVESTVPFSTRLISPQGLTVTASDEATNWETVAVPSGMYLLEIQWINGQSTVEKVVIAR